MEIENIIFWNATNMEWWKMNNFHIIPEMKFDKFSIGNDAESHPEKFLIYKFHLGT